jgi:hypothetical protein
MAGVKSRIYGGIARFLIDHPATAVCRFKARLMIGRHNEPAPSSPFEVGAPQGPALISPY